jgi:hypothetical protein
VWHQGDLGEMCSVPGMQSVACLRHGFATTWSDTLHISITVEILAYIPHFQILSNYQVS